MNITTYIARRYFFSKNSANAVNIISGISVLGLSVGTAALIIVLSVFNGLETLVKGFYNNFDPDLKVSLVTGKYFDSAVVPLEQIQSIEGVTAVSKILEERVLLGFNDKEYIASVKGVDKHFLEVSDISGSLVAGDYDLYTEEEVFTCAMGLGVAYYLGYNRMDFENPINVFIPKKEYKGGLDVNGAFSSALIYPSGLFNIQPEFDEKYVVAPLEFIQDLTDREASLTGLEIDLADNADLETVQAEVKKVLGADFEVQNRDEQQLAFLKVMKSESLFTFLVFALILSIATFTIMGSLTMLMLDKRQHLHSLWAMGMDIGKLRTLFFKEGMLINTTGAISGLALGMLLLILQISFGLIKLGQGYVIEAYPVELEFQDVVLVIVTVIALGSVTAWLTSRRLTLELIKSRES